MLRKESEAIGEKICFLDADGYPNYKLLGRWVMTSSRDIFQRPALIDRVGLRDFLPYQPTNFCSSKSNTNLSACSRTF